MPSVEQSITINFYKEHNIKEINRLLRNQAPSWYVYQLLEAMRRRLHPHQPTPEILCYLFTHEGR